MMISARDFHSVELSGGKTPPSEFRIWAYGVVRTTKGTFQLTRADADAIVKQYLDHGADLMIDYEHLAVQPVNAEMGKAAGWFKPEAREDGLWAVDVKWSPGATEMLKNGEYRYFSPWFGVDKKTKEIKELNNMALTNLPATKDLRPLVAASKGQHVTIAKEELAAALTKHMKSKGLSATEMGEKCSIAPERIEKLAKGDGTPTDEEHEKASTAMGYDAPGTDPDDQDPDKDGSDDDEDEGEKKKAAAKHPLTKEDDSMKTTKEPSEALDLVALTGRTDPKEQMGVLAAKLAKADRYDEDHKTLIMLRKENEDRRRQELITRGKGENKLTPSLIKFYASRSVSEFEAFLDEAAPVLNGPEMQPVEAGSIHAMLTRDEIELCNQLGRDPEVYAKFVQDEQSGKNRQAVLTSWRNPEAVVSRDPGSSRRLA